MELFDSHCHLLLGADIDAAVAAGVRGMVVNAVDIDDWTRIADTAAARHGVYGALGIHPWRVGAGMSPDWAGRLRETLIAAPALMVGETGLDKARPDIARQAAAFREHLQIAHDLGRVVHVHCVGAWGPMSDVLSAAPRVPALVFHAFSGSPDVMRDLARYNAYFSFGAAVMDVRHVRMRNAALCAPVHRVLVESDAPDSGFNPADLAAVVAQVAALRGCDAGECSDIIYNNSITVMNNGR